MAGCRKKAYVHQSWPPIGWPRIVINTIKQRQNRTVEYEKNNVGHNTMNQFQILYSYKSGT